MTNNKTNPVAIWLYAGAVAIVIQILLGGITRLTGSGLSITEWRPLLGTLPPITQEEWTDSFEKYKQIAQYNLVNSHFNLSDYKQIFFWEWLHRNWARFLGVIFIIPLLYFIITKKIQKKLIRSLFILFVLGLLQGVIGWIMVKSGLNNTDIRVSHIRLAIHFISAVGLLYYTLWLAFTISFQDLKMRHRLKFLKLTITVTVLTTIQLVYGAFMAGTSAALAATTWPDINGSIFPELIFKKLLSITSISHDLITIQFMHRMLAYAITSLIIILYFKTKSWKINKTLSIIRTLPLLVVLAQSLLGILTLLNSLHACYKYFALAHQFTGILLISLLSLSLYVNLKKD